MTAEYLFTRAESDHLNRFPRPDLSSRRDAYWEEMSLFYEVAGKPGWQRYDAQLPPIIGMVPANEQAFFTGIVTPRNRRVAEMLDPDGEDEAFLRYLHVGMPTTMSLIEQDKEAVGDPLLELDSLMVERTFTKAGGTPRPQLVSTFHLDRMSYFISNRGGTEFYQGPAQVRFLRPDYFELNVAALVQKPAISAPPFAIIRKGQLSPHRSPQFKKDGERTWMNVRTTHTNGV